MSSLLVNNPQDTAEDEDWGDDDEWEWEEDEDVEEDNVNGHGNDDEDDDDKASSGSSEVRGAPDIKIQGNILKIDRKNVDWSDDEYDEPPLPQLPPGSTIPVPPPPPPGTIPAPPPPPPAPGGLVRNEKASHRVEALKKRPDKRPDWKDLMAEIEEFRCGHGKLKKTVCNDRSNPILSTLKIGKNFIYESEKFDHNKDILKDIRKGVRLKHVRTNDRSKPFLRGIRQFRRQTTKEEKPGAHKFGFEFEDDILPEENEDENVDDLRDDLESTKQLLELEVRSKKLLERDNKRLQQEIEKLTKLLQGQGSADDADEPSTHHQGRRSSVSSSKRQSMISLIESVSSSNVNALLHSQTEDNIPATIAEDESGTETGEGSKAEKDEYVPPTWKVLPTELEVIESMKEEVEEARKLAEEWEIKYKEMQRQIADIDGNRRNEFGDGRRMSCSGGTGSEAPGLQRMVSSSSNAADDYNPDAVGPNEDDEETWMLKREIHMLENKLKAIGNKREVVFRERKLLMDRIDTITTSIGQEVEARKKLRKDLKEMNEAFKIEIEEMESEQRTAEELEDCYYSDEDELVVTKKKSDSADDYDDEDEYDDDDDVEETLDDILKLAEEDDNDLDDDPGHSLFENYPYSDDEGEDNQANPDWEKKVETMAAKVERHGENLQMMRKSNFMMKSKIDRLYDILQMQREKHRDLKQELTRMLADIQ